MGKICYSVSMNFISENTLIKIIKAGIYAIVFLPVIVLPLFFPFATSKGFLFQIIMECIFVLYLFVALKNKTFRPKRSIILYSLTLYFLIFFISTVTSIDIYRSFFGNYERMWGFFQISHFFLFFIVCIGIFKTAQEWKRLLFIALGAGSLVVSGGLYQFVSALVSGDVTPRISSTIGNAAYLAGYLLFMVIFSLYFYFKHKAELGFKKYVFGLLSLFSFVAILLTATRGALVALSASIIWVLLIALFVKTKKQIKTIASVLLLVVVLFSGWIVAYGSLFEKPVKQTQDQYYNSVLKDTPVSEESKFGFANRLTKFSFYDPTTQTRFITWQSVLSGVKENPLFGIGPENFALAFNEHFNSDFYTYEKYEIWFDRSHNIFVDTLVMNGFIGLLSYLVIFIACFYCVFSLYKRERITQLQFFIFNAFLTAYLIQNFFLFDSFSVFLVFILIIGFLHSLQEGEQEKQKYTPNLYQTYGVTTGMIIISFFAYYFTILPMMENYYIAQASSEKYTIDQSMELYKKALSYNTFGDNEARSRMALMIAKNVQSVQEQTLPDNLALYLDEGIKALEENIAKSDSYHLLYRLQLSDLYNLRLSHTGEVSPEIEDIIKKSITLSPGRMEFNFALAQTEFLKGNFQNAIDILNDASQKNPLHPMPYWKISQNYNFWAQTQHDPVKAKELIAQGIPFFEKAIYLGQGARTYQELLWVMQYYNEVHDYPRIVFINKLVLGFNPQNALPFHMNLALAYKELGQKDKAKEEALQVEQLDPSQKPIVDNFIQNL